jgi:prepilin-type N-terminal cleavage/methylation domain-containing protein
MRNWHAACSDTAIAKGDNIMKSQQSGFTLVEIAIVLVIIGLLLGGILKGQELINSAKVKNLANDFRVIPTYIYAYQDKFRSLPGDDSAAAAHVSAPNSGNGNGTIDGAWNADESSTAIESNLFWEHVRLANLAAGPTTPGVGFGPVNAMGGRVGVTSANAAQALGGLTGTYMVCSDAIPGKFVKQLDIQMDDGDTAKGSMRAVPAGETNPATAAVNTATINDGTNYAVCMAF